MGSSWPGVVAAMHLMKHGAQLGHSHPRSTDRAVGSCLSQLGCVGVGCSGYPTGSSWNNHARFNQSPDGCQGWYNPTITLRKLNQLSVVDLTGEKLYPTHPRFPISFWVAGILCRPWGIKKLKLSSNLKMYSKCKHKKQGKLKGYLRDR